MAEYKLVGTAQLLRLTKPWHGSGRAVSADSAFASVATAVALVGKMDFILQAW